MVYADISRPSLAIGGESGRSGVGITPAHDDLVALREGGDVHPDDGFALRVPRRDLVLALDPSCCLETKVHSASHELAVAEALVVKGSVALTEAYQHVPVGDRGGLGIGGCDVHRVLEGGVVAYCDGQLLYVRSEVIRCADGRLEHAACRRCPGKGAGARVDA